MKLREDNIHAHELLGLEAIILDKKGRKLAKGIIYDETKETLTLKIASKKKTFLKRSHNFIFKLDEAEVSLSGMRLLGRPEERIKKI